MTTKPASPEKQQQQQQHHQHHTHESSGYGSYSPLGTLERQYAEPVGKRVLLFVRTNPNVYLAGGVESIIKASHNNPGGNMSTASASTAGESATSSATSPTSPDGGGGGGAADPFSFLTDDADDGGDGGDASGGGGKHGKGHKIGRFFKKVAKNTTKTLERGMTNLAIRADGGKSPDWFFIGLYDATDGTVLSLTESKPVPMDETKKFNGLRFEIPLSLPGSIASAETVMLKVWVRSGAAMLHQRHYLIGQVPLNVNQLRTAVSSSGAATTTLTAQFMTMTMQSNMVADGKLFLCVTPDSKFSPLCGPGWSMADPDARPASVGAARHMFHLPLDQAYGLSFPPAPTSSWLIATERSVESSVVLPVAAAMAQLTAKAGRLSLQHMEAMSLRVHASRHDSTVGDYVDCAIAVGHLTMGGGGSDSDTASMASTMTSATSGTNQQQPQNAEFCAAFCSASWQRPDSIFEVDLLQPVRIPTTANNNSTPQTSEARSFRFFPKPVTENILPALLQASGGHLPSTGFLLGTLRMQITVSRPRRDLHVTQMVHNSTGGSLAGTEVETWESLIGLEGLLVQQQQQQQGVGGATTMEFPVYSTAADSARKQMGTLSLSVTLKMKHGPTLPARIDATGGLLSLMGVTPLCDSVQPDLDVVLPPLNDPSLGQGQAAAVPQQSLSRQQQQLATMGVFYTHAYTNYHCKSIRTADVKELEERATRYNAALTTETEAVPSHEDRNPKPFRPSSSRTELLLAGIPFNVHTASLSLQVLDNQQQVDASVSGTTTMGKTGSGGVFTNVTCGAPADHARNFGNIFPKSKDGTNTSAMGLTCPIGAVSGGLRRLEAQRVELAKHVSNLQTTLTAQVANFFIAERQQKNSSSTPQLQPQPATNHVPSRHDELQGLRWNLFEAIQSLHHVTWHVAMRRSACFSQALGTALTSYLASLSDPLKWQSTWPELWATHGYLVTFEGLLSAAGKELGMIEDASVGISMLRYVSVVFRSDDGATNAASSAASSSSSSSTKVPIVASPYLKWVQLEATHSGLAGTTPEYTLEIGVVPSYYQQRIPAPLQNGRPVRFYPLLFEVGVDIRQFAAHTGANMKQKLSKSEGDDPQHQQQQQQQPSVSILDDEDEDGGFADDDVLVELNYEAYNKLNAYAHSISPANSTASTSVQKIHPLLEKLYQHIVTSSGKMNHDILDEAALLSQQLGGSGIVFCKSGKDRTAMHTTYKQAQYANRFRQNNPSQLSGTDDGTGGGVFEDQTLEDATNMRIYGTRLPICEKNVGQAKYAFNSLQVKFMPDALKPPSNTLAGFLKGGKVFQGGGIES